MVSDRIHCPRVVNGYNLAGDDVHDARRLFTSSGYCRFGSIMPSRSRFTRCRYRRLYRANKQLTLQHPEGTERKNV